MKRSTKAPAALTGENGFSMALTRCKRIAVSMVAFAFGTLAVSGLFATATAISKESAPQKFEGFSESERKRIVSIGPWPARLADDPGNEYSGYAAAEELGERLFHDAALSSNGLISCASCHQADKAFTDNLRVAVGVLPDQPHVRNTQGLLDAGLQRWWGWDGGTDSQWAAALRPLLSPIEMGGSIESIASYLRANTDYVTALAELSLIQSASAESAPLVKPGPELNRGADEELLVNAAKSIAAYTRTLRSLPTPFDDYREALLINDKQKQLNYPIAAKRGLQIFLGEGNCHFCHLGSNFSNGEFHDTGRPFFTGVGQVDAGRYTGIKRVKSDPYNLPGKFNGAIFEGEIRKTRSVKIGQANWGQWRTPSLRNLTLTAPYMHDGSLATLTDVVEFYSTIDADRLHSSGEAILKPLNLSEQDKQALVCFLQSLTAMSEDQRGFKCTAME